MSRRFNNKSLIIVFATLLLLFVFVKFYQSVKTESTLKTNLVEIDTSKVSRILLYPISEKGKEIVFVKEGHVWKVSDGKVSTEIEKTKVNILLAQLIQMKSKGLTSRTKDKWAEYQVTDTSGTCVKTFEGGKKTLDLMVGKFTYQKSDNPYAGGGVIGTSYVRLANENEIYAVDGFLTFTFNQPFNSWRNQTLVKLNKSDITKLEFKYQGDSSFVVTKQDKEWVINGIPIDSTKLNNYLNSLGNKTSSSFDDSFIPAGNPYCELIIEGKNMSSLTVNAFVKEMDQFELNSSINSKAWFLSDRKGVFMDVFKGKKDFLDTKKK